MFQAAIWDRSTDQNGRPCWVNKNKGHACYALLDKGGLPLPFPGGFPYAPPQPTTMNVGAMPMMMAPGVPMCPPVACPPAAPVCPPAATTVAIVGDKVKVDKWSEYCDEATGKKYYHNPAKPTETTWDKPKDFDKLKNAGKPAPPSTKPKKKPKYGCTCSK